jgi:hypothetical protein
MELAQALPGAQVILAHCGISDLSWIWRDAQRLPNLYFDTSWWSAADVLSVCGLVPPGQILFASDTPYGTPLAHSLFVIRCALHAGMTPEQVRGVMGGQTERLVTGQEPLDLGPALNVRAPATDILLQRIATFLATAIGRIFSGADGAETLALARMACDLPEDDAYATLCASIARLLELHDLVAEPGEREPGSRGVHLIMGAMALAATPELGAPASA